MSLLDAAAELPRQQFSAGQQVIGQGDPAGPLYVLLVGAVAVERDGVTVARTDRPGAVFGEMSVALQRPATATVRCLTDAELAVATDAHSFLREHPDAAMDLLRVTAGRVDALTQYLVDVRTQYADRSDHLGMLDTVLDALTHHQAPPARPGSVRDPEV